MQSEELFSRLLDEAARLPCAASLSYLLPSHGYPRGVPLQNASAGRSATRWV